MADTPSRPTIVRHVEHGLTCCDPEWEAAYRRFETPAEEVAKFVGRLKRFGFDQVAKDIPIAEIFCGRGNGLVALQRLGFSHIEGVDLSESLLAEYRGPAQLHLADCKRLPFASNRYGAIIVHGGLHHLPDLPDDLDQTLAEVARVLAPQGRFYAVEPWGTPFLSFVHFVTDQPLVRRWYAKGDALATMTERERLTYQRWLSIPDTITAVLEKHFRPVSRRIRWGKLAFCGVKKSSD